MMERMNEKQFKELKQQKQMNNAWAKKEERKQERKQERKKERKKERKIELRVSV